ncbi:MAG TPA: tRNA (adenosine(37)-N6)-threonylcarbamoyltransferase complex dimerization subunit type 1 TsaB, partial [Deltaproteobacteria bacterium]|nr:tRNA (adenosine(37)-N6)-threonylcarbamoyltransferase complex dimerization subunit type 1 TsaB [Deltaproteobacteria bacterium]
FTLHASRVKMRLLALDTSGPSQSLALFQDGILLKENFERRPCSHSETLLDSIQKILAEAAWALAEIEAFAVTAGPGSFTGLRIGLSTVKGFCAALDKPALAVSTLEALAAPQVGAQNSVVACLDARCGAIYLGAYAEREGTLQAILSDRALPAAALASELEKIPGPKLLIGSAAQVYASAWSDLPQVELCPDAEKAEVHAAEVGK